MAHIFACLLTLFFSLSGPVMGECSDFWQSSNAAKKPMLPDEAWSKNAPHQVTPGTKKIEHFKYNKDTGRLKRSVVEYDDYGRQVRRTDYDNHGYGNPNSPDYHSNPHTHTYEYGPGYGPKGKETRTNQ